MPRALHSTRICSSQKGQAAEGLHAHVLSRRWDASRPGLTWRRFMDNKNAELDRLNGVYMKLLAGAKVEFIEGRGRVVDAHTVEVDGRRFTVRAYSGSFGQAGPARMSLPPRLVLRNRQVPAAGSPASILCAEPGPEKAAPPCGAAWLSSCSPLLAGTSRPEACGT